MARIRVEQPISAPPQSVWDDIADVGSHVEWMADAESITFLGDRREGAGTRMEVLTRVGPFSLTDVMEFTAWEPPTRMAVRHQGLVTGEGAFHLASADGGTRFVWDEELTFPWWLGGPVTAFLAAPVLRAIWKRNLKRLAARFD
jgi:hypothetical protein